MCRRSPGCCCCKRGDIRIFYKWGSLCSQSEGISMRVQCGCVRACAGVSVCVCVCMPQAMCYSATANEPIRTVAQSTQRDTHTHTSAGTLGLETLWVIYWLDPPSRAALPLSVSVAHLHSSPTSSHNNSRHTKSVILMQRLFVCKHGASAPPVCTFALISLIFWLSEKLDLDLRHCSVPDLHLLTYRWGASPGVM